MAAKSLYVARDWSSAEKRHTYITAADSRILIHTKR